MQMVKKVDCQTPVKSRECITENPLEHPVLTVQRGKKISQNGKGIIEYRASTPY